MSDPSKEKYTSEKNMSVENIDELVSYRDLVEHAPICIHEIGVDGCIKKMNRSGLAMMGKDTQADIYDAPYTCFVGKQNKQRIDKLLEQAIMGKAIPNFEFSVQSPDETRTFTSSFIPMRNSQGVVVKLMGMTSETTNETRAKEALKHNNEQLRHKIDSAIKGLQDNIETLNATRSQLLESEKMASLGGLVAGVTHEVNTPLGIGVTAASFLTDATANMHQKLALGTISKKDLTSFLQQANDLSYLISSNLNKASALLESFKHVAVDQSSKHLRHYDLKNYLNEILLTLKPKMSETAFVVNLNCADNILIYGEPGALSQIITNLVTNSLTHGFEGLTSGTIDITITQDNHNIFICYKDSGMGIAINLQDKIFDQFFTTKRSQGGSGLGLNIVLNLVTKSLKGKIKCESEPNKGCQFTITFPKKIPTNSIINT
ncbi:MAG: HAMP domain-containing histidine kinase [Psychrobium sp.]|nr:HAMP domain-containing histidine kinase [Psychrobium sp.]